MVVAAAKSTTDPNLELPVATVLWSWSFSIDFYELLGLFILCVRLCFSIARFIIACSENAAVGNMIREET